MNYNLEGILNVTEVTLASARKFVRRNKRKEKISKIYEVCILSKRD